jgi:hypothetical protein
MKPFPALQPRWRPSKALPEDERGSSGDREQRLADAARRAAGAAGRYKQDAEVMQRVDAVLESVPPSSATYILRLLTHAEDPQQVRRPNSAPLVLPKQQEHDRSTWLG